jgi:hypothetical protein
MKAGAMGKSCSPASGEGEVMSTDPLQQIDYNTHILVGCLLSGTMTVICHWPYVPRQEEVQQKISPVQESYAAFLLCTPTAIMRVGNDAAHKRKSSRTPGSR